MDEVSITSNQEIPDLKAASDQDYLRHVVWRKSPNAALADAAGDGDLPRFCKLLKRSSPFAGRFETGKVQACLDHGAWQVLWSLPAFVQTDRTARLLRLLTDLSTDKHSPTKKSRAGLNGAPKTLNGAPERPTKNRTSKLVSEWLEEMGAGGPLSPIELLASFELLRRTSSKLDTEVLFKLWRTSHAGVLELSGAGSNQIGENGEPILEDQALLIRGELPWQAGVMFPDIQRAEKFQRAGAKYLWQQLESRTDTDGTPHAELMSRLPLWLAPLVRVSCLSQGAKAELWSKKGQDRYRALVKTVAAYYRSSGETLLGGTAIPNATWLPEVAFQSAGLRQKHPRLHWMFSMNGSTGVGKPPRQRKLHSQSKASKKRSFPSAQSDWARLACLRTERSAHSDSIAVAHHRPTPLLDVTALGRCVLRGPWGIELAIGGNPVSIESEWEAVCWQSDGDSDYLELQTECADGVHIERQILLSRTDHLLVLADAISGVDGQPIQYASSLPITEGTKARRDADTRSISLQSSGVTLRTYPLALPEDRALSTSGEFTIEESRLTLRQTGAGRGLFAPLVLDWSPDRKRHPAQWRSLTVSENKDPVTPDIAAGHRLRVGNFQMLVYRSLLPSDEARAVLGHHSFKETIIGRFTDFGEVEPYILVEPGSES